jgi:hypothetical protein
MTFPGYPDWTQALLAVSIAVAIPCALALVTFGRTSPLTAKLLKWTSYVAVGLVIFVAIVLVHTMVFLGGIDAIHAAAGKEGCIVFDHDWHSVMGNTAAIALIVLLYAWTAWRLRRFESRIVAQQRQPA